MLFKNKAEIKQRLLNTLHGAEPIRTYADAMIGGGSHSWYLEGNDDDFRVCCYGSGPNWSDQSDEYTGTIDQAVTRLWNNRRNILAN